MISTVSKVIDGDRHAFKMSARAMRALETSFGLDIFAIMDQVQGGFPISKMVEMIAECAGDGKGGEIEVADAVVDALGLPATAKLLGEIVGAAFPAADGEAAPGDGSSEKK